MLMDCKLVPNDDPKYKFKCSECGELYEREIRSNCPKYHHQQPEQPQLPCAHRGQKSRAIVAKRCCGATYEVESFFCRKHGECALYPYTPVDGEQPVKSCATCSDISIDRDMPHIATRMASFSKEFVRHVALGSRYASPEQVQERWNHCEKCAFREGSVCKLCGCLIANQANSTNKLAWAEQECPHNPPFWGPV